MKNCLFTLLLCCVVATLSAQTNEQVMTVRGTMPAGATDAATGTYVAVGQPFFQQVSNASYEVSFGVAQAQLGYREISDETCQNVSYTENHYDIPAPITPGTDNHELYLKNLDPEGYDSLFELTLTVWDTFTVETSEMYHGFYPVIPGSLLQNGTDYQIVDGENVINFSSEHGCDSVVTLFASLCPYTVDDYDGHTYNTLVLRTTGMSPYCWTKENLQSTRYYDGVEVPVARVYTNTDYPDAAANEALFGRLYTWQSAVRIPEGTLPVPPVDEAGFVRGVCPEGWHLPAVPETAALERHSTNELHTPDYWISGGGVNSSEFTLLPAGIFSSSNGRYENLLGMTRLWKISSTPGVYSAICTEYSCDGIVTSPAVFAEDGYSVRCVKNY